MAASEQTAFVTAHIDAPDLTKLLLSANRFPQVDVRAAVEQIKALRSIKEKIPEWFDYQLVMPPAVSVEQASSALTAQYKMSLLSGQRLADLTGGMGVDSYYASKVFDEVVYVEQQAHLVEAARHNFTHLGVANIQCVHASAADWLASQPDNSLSIIYLDPARRDDKARRTHAWTDCQPDVVALMPELLRCAPRVLIKASPMLDITLSVQQLGKVEQVWVVAVDNEVKEVLYLIDSASSEADPPIVAVDLGRRASAQFQRTQQSEHDAHVHYGPPGKYLYEPNAAVLKAGGFRSFAAHYGLRKLHANTHLYTSDTWVEAVPGRAFCVRATCKYDRKEAHANVPDGYAHIATRNFPDTTEAVRKKLGFRDGGTTYLFAATGHDGKLLLLICDKI
jgi:THUMP domain-like